MEKSRRKLAIAASFLIPMFLTGIIWLPLVVIYTIGSIMAGWPEILGVIILIALFFLLSYSPWFLLNKFGVRPQKPVLPFLLGFLLNILAVITTVLALFFFDKLTQ